jgi:hypothetical protein
LQFRFHDGITPTGKSRTERRQPYSFSATCTGKNIRSGIFGRDIKPKRS